MTLIISDLLGRLISISEKEKLTVPIDGADQEFEIVKFLQKDGKLFALMMIPVEDLSRIRMLKTDKKTREYQRVAQKKYRRKKYKKKENTIDST